MGDYYFEVTLIDDGSSPRAITWGGLIDKVVEPFYFAEYDTVKLIRYLRFWGTPEREIRRSFAYYFKPGNFIKRLKKQARSTRERR